jgi:choline-sulfatase
MNRREFINLSGAAGLSMGMGRWSDATGIDMKKTNIVLIMVDQLYAEAMSCRMGNEYLNTPALDKLVAEGMLFSRAYTASPVCIPARNAMFTGRYPYDTGIECNRSHPRNPLRGFPRGGNEAGATLSADYRCLGQYFSEAGWDTAYFGKWHLNMLKEDKRRHGFTTTGVLFNTGHDPEIAHEAAQYIRQPHEKPFLAVVQFCDPHDICQYAANKPLPGGALPEPPPVDDLPPLLPNAAPTADEGDILKTLRTAYNSVHTGRGISTPAEIRKWREHRWAYYRLIERVDALIGDVLKAIDDAGHADDTVVVFTSDHGEMMGAHGLVQKTFFYEEAVHVPLVIRQPGFTPGTCDDLVNNGVDILPTLLSYAGIRDPEYLPGRDLRPLAEGARTTDRRDYIISHVHFCNTRMPKHIPHTYGRMVRSRRYSYWLLDHGKQREVLFDTKKDPGQMHNLAPNPESKPIIEQHRAFLTEYAIENEDWQAMDMLRTVTG